VGTHPLHAVGVGWAAKLKGDKIVTVAYFGDGATSKGDFHEAMNFAGVFKNPEPSSFCQNNQFAILCSEKNTDCIRNDCPEGDRLWNGWDSVDGNDLLPSLQRWKRQWKKLALGRFYLYRGSHLSFGPHTRQIDPTKYRQRMRLSLGSHSTHCQVAIFISKRKGSGAKRFEQRLTEEGQKEIDQVGEGRLKQFAVPTVERNFQYVYAEMTPQLKEQLEYLKSTLGWKLHILSSPLDGEGEPAYR